MTRWIVLAVTAAALIGRWHGTLTLFGENLDLAIEVSGPADSVKATIDIPSQGVSRAALRDLRTRGDSVSFVFPVPGEAATFAGIQRGDSITGMFRQAGLAAPFRLARGAAPVAADPSLPYEQEDVRIPGRSVTLAGTLTRPRGTGPYPALVLVSGSGAQNRDENVLGFKPFAILADHLTRNGIAVLRCDDRGVGESSGDFEAATSLDFADDLRAQIRFLGGRKDIDRRRIGAFGHSEGGIIAPMVAADSDSIAFLILFASPGIRGDSVILDQGARIGRASGWNDTMTAVNRRAQERIIAASATGQGWDDARTATEAALRRAMQIVPGPAGDSVLASVTDAQMKAMRSPWMRGFLAHDPAPVLAKVKCPVLALFGEHDLQVSPEANAAPTARALARNPDVTVRVVPRANHLFQQTDDGNPMLYGSLKKEFVPGLLDTVTTGLAARTRRR